MTDWEMLAKGMREKALLATTVATGIGASQDRTAALAYSQWSLTSTHRLVVLSVNCKTNKGANEMDIELLAKQMRESALLRTANPNLTMQELTGAKLQIEKRNQIERVEKMQKLYFNAGRWAGGARDHNAREAHYKVMGE